MILSIVEPLPRRPVAIEADTRALDAVLAPDA
jgi:hypothetical protein